MNSDESVEHIEIRLFLEAIHARYGYDLRGYAQASMRRRVLSALAKSGVAHLGELQYQILRNPDLLGRVLENLTVPVTEMFRDPTFHRTFRERVVPVLRTYPLLKIWHAGCATGEEVYAIAILLTEEGLYERAQIYATDISVQALAQAKQGVYSAKSLQGNSERYGESGGTVDFSNYYTEAYDHVAMRESLRKNVLFFQHNLVSDHAFAEMNVIFCRNVLIYFGSELRGRVLEKFAQSLGPGAFLCLGSSERLTRSSHAKQNFSDFAPDARIYRHAG